MENPTLEQMEAWRDQATERLSLFARSNAIEEPIGIGEECYQLGEDCYKPDRYDQFRWVTEDQFDSVLPPGIEHDRYIAMTNMTGFDDEIKEWSANWNDPGYWHDAAADALWSSNDGAYWTTRDEDPSDAVMARATAASQIALELDADNLIERTPENIGLLHDIVDTVHGMDPESDLGYYRAYPSETARETVGEHLIDGEIAEKTMYGGWNPDRDRYLRVNKDGDWVGMDQTTADRLVWDNRTPILESVGAYADDMPADLTDRVCVMDERFLRRTRESAGPVDRRRPGRLVPSQRADHSRSGSRHRPELRQRSHGSRNRNVRTNHVIHRYGTVPRGHQPVSEQNRHALGRIGRKSRREPGDVHPHQKRLSRHPRGIRATVLLIPTQSHRLHAGTPNKTNEGTTNGRREEISIDGKDFTIEDVELRSGPAWANGPRRADAELPDGQVLGSIVASDGEWLWRLAGEKWNHTEPAEGPIAEYIGHEPNRLSAIRSLLQAIEDRYSATAADDPWASMPDAHSTTTMPDAVSQTQPAQVGDPWASAFPDANALPDPDPGIDQGAMPATGPGIGM